MFANKNQSHMRRILSVLEHEFGRAFANLVDVGAALGTNSRWKEFYPLIKTIGFEPGRQEFEKLVCSETELWINTALASNNESRTIYLTKYWSNTSLLRPNQTLLDTLAWGDDHRIVGEETIACDTIDAVLEEKKLGLDFLKVDTQGTELDILQGATASIKSTTVVEVEVEFAPLYQGQPLFADVDSFLRSQGFYLHDLGNVLHVKPRSYPSTGGPKGRIISADALYFRDPQLAVEIIGSHDDRKMAALLIGYLAYGFPELCLLALEALKKQGKQRFWTESIKADILNIQHSSQTLRWLPAQNILARIGRKCWQSLYKTNGSLWDFPLGNKLF